MRNIEEVIRIIKSNESKIINRISMESVDVYRFLHREFMKGDITKNFLFQFVYRSFYRLDNAGLTDDFKQEYFKIMEENRLCNNPNPREIVKRLYNFKRIKGDNSIQFSFTTKLINTVKNDYPIFDSEVAKVFKFSTYNIKDVNRKVERYLEQQNIIIDTYYKILNNNLLSTTFESFDNKFNDNELTDIKKLDFIVWACGKVI